MTTLTRLRPVVQATRLPHGLHVRGWHSSFTMTGGDPVWRLWERLERSLVEGVPAAELTALGRRSAAVGLVEEQLRRHDMLVEVPASWVDGSCTDAPAAEVRSWLECLTDQPAAAWERLRGSSFAVLGEGPVAWAAHRALTALDLSVTSGPTGPGAEGYVQVVADSVAVWVLGDDRAGAVLPPQAVTGPAAPPAGARQLSERLGITRVVPAATALQSLLGANAAHRLICAVAGLPDPAVDRGAPTPAGAGGDGASWHPPAVFVARMDPLRGDYHPWLCQAARSGAAKPVAHVLDAQAAGQRLDALCDPEVGPLERVLPADLPQVPAALAVFRHGSDLHAGTAPTFEVARLVAGRAAAQAALGEEGTAYAGSDGVEARGRALRAAWMSSPLGIPVPEGDWADHPAARRWLKVLTLNFGQRVTVSVDRLADGVYRARLDLPGVRHPAVALEASPGDAVAFAAVSAAGALQLQEAGLTACRPVAAPCGATPATPAPDPQGAEDAWSWPAGVRVREDSFQTALSTLPDGRRLTVVAADPALLHGFAATHAAAVVTR